MTELKICCVPLQVELEVGIVIFGETGYHKTDWGQVAKNEKELFEFVDRKNKALGVSKAEAEAMHSCSLFDCWHNYDAIVESYNKALKGEIK